MDLFSWLCNLSGAGNTGYTLYTGYSMYRTLLSVSCGLVLGLAVAPSWVWVGRLLKRECSHSPLSLRILSSTGVPFVLAAVRVLNLALTHKRRITVHTVFLPLSSRL
jgi:hypothetical protein